jgi:Seven in absentia protein family/Zinc finger, C3HC4 type (RING finger)
MSGEAGTNQNDNTLIRQLKEFIECTVCYSVPDATPIYQCNNGHLFCDECNEKLNSCPFCRVRLSNVRVRSLVAEKFLDKIPTRCNFEDYGCNMILPREDLPTHGKDCKFRQVLCPRGRCDEMVSLAQIAEHFEIVHKRFPTEALKPLGEYFHSSLKLKMDFRTSMLDRFWNKILFFNGIYFFGQVAIITDATKTSRNWYIWMVAGLSEDECQNFVCDLKICNADSGDTLLKIGPVVSVDVERTQVLIIISFIIEGQSGG